ncbi:LacI family DNA-binding transcriptional regulator [Kribbella sp. NPDC050281]|uniref:LacI family DNA-binding transcriptional regulator n=1 Tax=Kribbella sp. NPDC050281 TaxID=3155515 RepID=UPI0033C0803B
MRRTRQVTILSVAAAAGVSKSTVSRVMNETPNVDPQIVIRVRDAAARLGYRPSGTAQNLSRGRTGIVGVLVPDLANPLFATILKGISAEAEQDGYRTLVADANEQPDAELRHLNELARQSDGLILCGPRMSMPDLAGLADLDVPIVVVNRKPAGSLFPSVTVDSREAVADLCRHLDALGHTRLCYLTGPAHAAADGERWSALKSSIRSRTKLSRVAAGAMLDDGHAAAEAALATGATCLIGFNDLVALGAVARLQELGIAVPDQISVAGFDDIVYARFTSPGLTTVAMPKTEFGEEAWRLLSPYLHGRKTRRTRTLSATLIIRGSTGLRSHRTN